MSFIAKKSQVIYSINTTVFLTMAEDFEVTTKIKKFFSDLYKLLDIEDIALSSKEAYKNELKRGVGSEIGKSLFNKFSIEDIILSSKEAYKSELKKGMGLQIGKSLFNKFSINEILLSSKESFKNELKKGVGSQIGK